MIRLFTIAAVSSLALLTAMAPAMASFSSVHKSSFGGKDKVIVPGQAPDAVVTLTSPVTAVKPLTLNNCGWSKVTESTTAPVQSLSLGGSTLSIVAGAAPTCVKAVAPATGYVDSNAGDPVGTAVKVANVIWIKGGSALGAASVDVITNKLINSKANACGFASFTVSPTRTLASFIFGGSTLSANSVPTTTGGGMICRKNSTGTGVVFVPLGGF